MSVEQNICMQQDAAQEGRLQITVNTLEDYFPVENAQIQISYTGDGFLQQMIRIMTGTLIEVGNRTKQPEDIMRILDSKMRENAGYTVPAEGLALKSVEYKV